MKITITITDSEVSSCSNSSHYKQNFDKTLYSNKGYFIKEVFKSHPNTAGIQVQSPNGDKRELPPMRIDLLQELLNNLCGIEIL